MAIKLKLGVDEASVILFGMAVIALGVALVIALESI